MNNARFEIYRDTRGAWRWRLRSDGNWEIVAVASEGYSSAEAAERSA